MVAFECFKHIKFGGARLRDQILQAENGQKLTSLNQYNSLITDTREKGFVVFQHIFNYLSFDYVRLPRLKTIFLVLDLFSYFFFFFCRYLLFNR